MRIYVHSGNKNSQKINIVCWSSEAIGERCQSNGGFFCNIALTTYERGGTAEHVILGKVGGFSSDYHHTHARPTRHTCMIADDALTKGIKSWMMHCAALFYEPSYPSLLVGWLVAVMSQFLKRTGSYTSMILSEHRIC